MTEPLDLDALAADVAAEAAARRARGDYPPGLEEELDEHFRIVSRRVAPASEAITAIDTFTNRPPLLVPTDVDTSSSIPGGARLHRAIGGTVVRHQVALVEELNDVLSALNATLLAIAAALDPAAKVETEIAGRLDAIEGRLAELQRRANDG